MYLTPVKKLAKVSTLFLQECAYKFKNKALGALCCGETCYIVDTCFIIKNTNSKQTNRHMFNIINTGMHTY